MSNVQSSIESKLTDALTPSFIEVVNESANHNVPAGSESHFKVVIVADAFEGKAMIQRHRMVNAALREEIDGPVHALSLHTYTATQWLERSGKAPQSPDCLGGKADEAKRAQSASG